jgi:hypothetical protein
MLTVKTWLRVRKCEQGHKFIVNKSNGLTIISVIRILDGQIFYVNTFVNCFKNDPEHRVFINNFNDDLKTVEITGTYRNSTISIGNIVDIDDLIILNDERYQRTYKEFYENS